MTHVEQAGCLNIENDIIDTTTEEGKKHVKDMEEAGTGLFRLPVQQYTSVQSLETQNKRVGDLV